MLKSRCREFGIQRWPYRKVKKLDNLIGALAKDGGAGAELLVELKDCREYLLANPNSNAHNTLGKIKAAKKGKRAGARKAAVLECQRFAKEAGLAGDNDAEPCARCEGPERAA